MLYRPLVVFLFAYAASFLLGIYAGGRLLAAGTAAAAAVTVYWKYKHGDSIKGILPAVFFFWLFGALQGRMAFIEQREGMCEEISGYTAEGTVLSMETQEIKETQNQKTKLIIRPKGKRYKIAVTFYDPTDAEELSPGDTARITGTLLPLELPENPGGWDGLLYYKAQGIEYTLQAYSAKRLSSRPFSPYALRARAAGRIEDRLRHLLPEETSGTVAAMLLGDRAGVDADLKELFQDSGIAHIIAISGLHLQILSEFARNTLQKIMRKRKASAVCLILIWGFCFLTGGSVSTVRASLMISFRYGAELLWRASDEKNSLAAAALCILLFRPLALFSAGFQLSFAACFALSSFTLVFQRLFFLRKRIRDILSASAAVSLFSAPITLFHFYKLCPYAFLLNLVVIPMMGLVISLSILSLLLSLLSVPAAAWLMGGVYYILKLYAVLSRLALSLPGSLLRAGRPSYLFMLVFYGEIGLLIWRCHQNPIRRKKARRVQYLIVLLGVLCWAGTRNAVTLALLSTGQGDCAVLTAYGKTYIIDAGPRYEQVLQPYLEKNGVTRIEGIFLSHMDADHTEGALQMLEEDDFTVERIFLPKHRLHEEAIPESLREGRVTYWERGDFLQIRNVRLDCLSPVSAGDYANENAAAMVLHIRLKDVTILMTGDIDQEAEATIPEQDLPSDVLKVAHHGSKTSSSAAFLKAVAPAVAFISCGKNNSYGHPNEEVLSRLAEQNIPYRLSYADGALLITNGKITGYREAYRKRWMS